MTRSAVVVLASMLLALGKAPAGAAVRQHVVVEIRSLPGASGPATVTLPNGRPETLTVHRVLPDGARIDVPLRVTVVIASTDAKSTTTLRPDTSFTLVATGAGERSSVAHGSAVFSVVHGALDFFQVKYGNTFTASARGTVFSFDTSGRKVTFACERGVVDVAYAARLQIGAAKRNALQLSLARTPAASAETAPAVPVPAGQAVKAIDVITATGTSSASFPLDVPEYVQTFATAAAVAGGLAMGEAAAATTGAMGWGAPTRSLRMKPVCPL